MLTVASLASSSAFRYLRIIPREAWRSKHWKLEEFPRRYGRSNASEAANSLLREARSLIWEYTFKIFG